MRAEFGPHQIDTAKRGILPQELRSGAVAARILLSSLTLAAGGKVAVEAFQTFTGSNNSIAQAAGKDCKNTQLLVVGVGYINHPLEPNRPKQADPVDMVIGSPEFGIAVIDRINNPQDPNSARAEIARGNLVNRGLYTSQVFRLSGLSNTLANDGSEAMEVAFYFDDDPAEVNPQTGKSEKPRVKAVVKCGFTVPVWGGRSAPQSEIERAFNNPQYEFRTVASVVNEAMKTVTGKSAGLSPEKVMQTEVRRALKEFFDNKKAEEKAKALITPTAIVPPAATATAIATATATATPAPDGNKGGNKDDGKNTSANGSIPVLSGAWEFTKLMFDLPAKGVDWIIEPDTQNPVRGVINVAGWLVGLGALFNRRLRGRPTGRFGI